MEHVLEQPKTKPRLLNTYVSSTGAWLASGAYGSSKQGGNGWDAYVHTHMCVYRRTYIYVLTNVCMHISICVYTS